MGSRSEFQILSRYGQRYRTKLLWVRHLGLEELRARKADKDQPFSLGEHTGQAGVHVSYAISRAIGNAVTRNRIKRRLRAAFESVRSELSLSDGLYLVGIHRANIKSADFGEIKDNIVTLNTKIEQKQGR